MLLLCFVMHSSVCPLLFSFFFTMKTQKRIQCNINDLLNAYVTEYQFFKRKKKKYRRIYKSHYYAYIYNKLNNSNTIYLIKNAHTYIEKLHIHVNLILTIILYTIHISHLFYYESKDFFQCSSESSLLSFFLCMNRKLNKKEFTTT